MRAQEAENQVLKPKENSSLLQQSFESRSEQETKSETSSGVEEVGESMVPPKEEPEDETMSPKEEAKDEQSQDSKDSKNPWRIQKLKMWDTLLEWLRV